MVYRVNYSDGVIEFVKNKGRAFLEADSPQAAIRQTRELFEYTRDERAKALGDNQYLVTFKVTLDYRLPLLRSVEKAVKLLRSVELYTDGRYIDRYMVATVFRETGKPEFLAELDIKDEISSLRKSAVVAREVPNIMSFVDIDIVTHNHIELNSKTGYKSRVVRKVKARSIW
jgi:hypothetical protein